MEILQLDYAALALSIVQVALGVVVLILAKLALGFLSPYSTDKEMTSNDNPAFGLALAGYFAGTVIVYLSASASAPLPLDDGAKAVFLAMGGELAWALAGIAALNGSRWLMDRLLVTHIRNDHEITEHRNLAAGALECGAYVASATLLAGAIRQPGGTPWTELSVRSRSSRDRRTRSSLPPWACGPIRASCSQNGGWIAEPGAFRPVRRENSGPRD